jgi:hypothetical protein
VVFGLFFRFLSLGDATKAGTIRYEGLVPSSRSEMIVSLILELICGAEALLDESESNSSQKLSTLQQRSVLVHRRLL